MDPMESLSNLSLFRWFRETCSSISWRRSTRHVNWDEDATRTRQSRKRETRSITRLRCVTKWGKVKDNTTSEWDYRGKRKTRQNRRRSSLRIQVHNWILVLFTARAEIKSGRHTGRQHSRLNARFSPTLFFHINPCYQFKAHMTSFLTRQMLFVSYLKHESSISSKWERTQCTIFQRIFSLFQDMLLKNLTMS